MPITQTVSVVVAPKSKVRRYNHAKARRQRAAKIRLRQYYNDPVAFMHDCFSWPEGMGPTEYQDELLRELVARKRVAGRGCHGLGKDLDVLTPIPTPSGWTTMGEIQAGDIVLNELGQPTTVTYAEEPKWREAHEVRFSDGSTIIAGAGHLWTAIDVYHRPTTPRPERKTIQVNDWRNWWDAGRTVETRDIAATLRSPGGQLRWRIPTTKPLDLPEVELPIDPYVLGAWLGDGTSLRNEITASQSDIEHLQSQVERRGYRTRIRQNTGGRAPTLCIEGLLPRLRDLGVYGAKHIPQQYLRASVEQRRELVRGLWDTDGYRQAGGSDEITLMSKTLIGGVMELLQSLGLSARFREDDAKMNGRVVGRRYRVGVRFDFDPYTLPRYDWEPAVSQASRHTQRTIVSAEPVGVRLTKCIAVDSERHLFLAGEAMIPTHNTMCESMAVLWFAITRDAAQVDWKVITTASAWRQLEKYLWPEIHKWARIIKWDRIGRAPFTRHELLQLSLNLKYGQASSVASDDPAHIEGAHADSILYLFDEAKAIPTGTWEAAEGAFSGDEASTEAFALAMSTPGEPNGTFYEICVRSPKYTDWHAIHVTLERAIAAKRVSRDWSKKRAEQWGADSAVYANRVLGEFHSADEDGVIPLSWIEQAVARWKNTQDQLEKGLVELGELTTVGVDVARSGEDSTIQALRYGMRIHELRVTKHEDTMKTTGRVKGVLDAHEGSGAVAIIDTDGLGAGVTDRSRELGCNVVAFHAGAKSDHKDRSKELGFINVRAAAWWRLREALDPTYGSVIELPPDPELLGDLTAPHWTVESDSRIKIESKKDIKKRLGRSTDRADAVVQSFWEERKKRRRRMYDATDLGESPYKHGTGPEVLVTGPSNGGYGRVA